MKSVSPSTSGMAQFELLTEVILTFKFRGINQLLGLVFCLLGHDILSFTYRCCHRLGGCP